MSSSVRRPVRSALALALALAAVPALAQDSPYSKSFFFGDSLTDSGYFRPALIRAVGPSGALVGRFTTNPGLVWSEYVAEFYGTAAVSNNQGGTNYAVGGARTGTNATGPLGAIPSLTTQVNTYLTSTGARADPHALYTVWGGANDLFAVAAGAPAQTTITAAVTAQIGIVGALQRAGARYVLVPTVPDLGVTPSFRAQGPVGSATGTQLATTYNNALFGGLSAAGLRVIPLDTFHLLQEVVASPAQYGFTNVTGTACQPQITAQSLTCSPTNYVVPNAADTYAFADGVHPSSKAHRIVADYALSVLEGPRQISLLTQSAANVGRSRAERVATHLPGKPEADGMRWWGSVRADSQRYDRGELYDGIAPAGLFGVDWARGAMVYGGFAGYGSGTQDFGRNAGSFKQSDASLGGFAAWYGERAWVNGQLSYTWIANDVDRDVQLGEASRTHSGSPDGTNLSAGVSAGFELGDGAFRQGPVVSLLSQRIDLEGYAESNPSSTALTYADQSFDSLVGSVGWQASYAINEHLRPYARLTYDREFQKWDGEVSARLQSIPGLAPYVVPSLNLDHNYSTVLVGARTQVLGLDADIGLTATVGQKGGTATNATAFATLSGSF